MAQMPMILTLATLSSLMGIPYDQLMVEEKTQALFIHLSAYVDTTQT